MGWTTPRTWIAGELVTAAILNTHVRDNLNALHQSGTWTPVIGGDGGTSGQSYTTQTGAYIRVGDIVQATFNVALSNKGTIAGNVILSGLPFTTVNTSSLAAPLIITMFTGLATNWTTVGGYAANNAAVATIRGCPTGAGPAANTQLTTADLTNAAQFVGLLSYQAVSA